MWRSEPQIAVLVIFTMQSRWLRIFGSGTSRTSMCWEPIQQFAFMSSSWGFVRRAAAAAPVPAWVGTGARFRERSGACRRGRLALGTRGGRLPVARRRDRLGLALGEDRLLAILQP